MASLDYLAGLFDGEGSFSIQVGLRRYRTAPSIWLNPSMSVNLYYGAEVLQEFVATFGGTIYPYAKGGQRWHLGRRADVLAAAQTLQPLLIVKRDIAGRFIEALSMWPTTDQGRVGERIWTTEAALAVAEIALALNPPRSRKTNKTAEYVHELRAALERSA